MKLDPKQRALPGSSLDTTNLRCVIADACPILGMEHLPHDSTYWSDDAGRIYPEVVVALDAYFSAGARATFYSPFEGHDGLEPGDPCAVLGWVNPNTRKGMDPTTCDLLRVRNLRTGEDSEAWAGELFLPDGSPLFENFAFGNFSPPAQD